ncbi:unnamed protein product [Pleuronectes platessa]|uniref:Uncharacterized protein n=1 Tax=Pleuronectes platessa TaxID=8262 RepID=A0A9N7VRT1_PLEPL|nr:unnamed protein product [Pleuronectes platessa]
MVCSLRITSRCAELSYRGFTISPPCPQAVWILRRVLSAAARLATLSDAASAVVTRGRQAGELAEKTSHVSCKGRPSAREVGEIERERVMEGVPPESEDGGAVSVSSSPGPVTPDSAVGGVIDGRPGFLPGLSPASPKQSSSGTYQPFTQQRREEGEDEKSLQSIAVLVPLCHMTACFHAALPVGRKKKSRSDLITTRPASPKWIQFGFWRENSLGYK